MLCNIMFKGLCNMLVIITLHFVCCVNEYVEFSRMEVLHATILCIDWC